jgi:hypothetical protein
MSTVSPADAAGALRRWALVRTRSAWIWSILAFALIALPIGFGVWVGLHFNNLYGYWRAVVEMEVGALRVPPGESLSVMLPIWIGLGLLAYSLAVGAMLRLWWADRRWRALVWRVLGNAD